MPNHHLSINQPPIAKPIALAKKDHNTPLKHRMINPQLIPPIIEPIDMFQNLTGLFKQLLNRTLSIIKSRK
ncbi:hypothetical protein [Candidatus Tisiphia endosymbiont of Oplodontha viridula]|uniref:hypothetical protein n=1 Tax=Candidatus Tisiphia endosymbiont of Oplodontha viridula TaxID=3077925 RepID=UPI0035C90E4A